ncbi:alpha/beta fold hydrolase [Streptomyces sp. NPDC056773]|uniref:alpha/beta fold hydrolase n=1 Tax=unclassified Streptomyces TaxID=2593676 RepID=UPI0036BE9969
MSGLDASGQERWTRSGVRLRAVSRRAGRWNWLFVPGGPGLGSESVRGLAEAADVPGTVWLVDLPGEGSNRGLPQIPEHPYAQWPGVLAEAAGALDDVVMVGHSTGGMFLLSVPELEDRIAGMALVSSAPHAGWRTAFGQWAEAHPLPAVEDAATAYARHPGDETLRALTLAAADWNFTPGALAAGRAALKELPYCHDAAAWADAHFDDGYEARWKPGAELPTLIVSGAEDRVVDQSLWQADPAFDHPHVLRYVIDGAGHFPWIENPQAVGAAFTALVSLLQQRSTA